LPLFWTDYELRYLKATPLFQGVIRLKNEIEKSYAQLVEAVDVCLFLFFIHVCLTVLYSCLFL